MDIYPENALRLVHENVRMVAHRQMAEHVGDDIDTIVVRQEETYGDDLAKRYVVRRAGEEE